MSVVLVVALVGPVVAAATIAFLPDDARSHAVVDAALVTSLGCWAAVGWSGQAAVGQIRPDSLGPVIAIGVVLCGAAIARATRPRGLVLAGALAMLAVLAAVANLGERPESPLDAVRPPETSSLVALAVVGLVIAVPIVVRWGGLIDTALVVVAGLAIVFAAVASDGDPVGTEPAVALVVAMVAVTAGLARPEWRAAAVLLAVGLAVAARVTAAGGRSDDLEPIGSLVAALTAAAVLAIVVVAHSSPRAAGGPVALLGLTFALTPGLNDSRPAFLLLSAGAVLVATSGRTAGLVAVWPGAAAALVSVSRTDDLAATVVLAVALIAASGAVLGAHPAHEDHRAGLTPLVAAVVFAIAPTTWRWAEPTGLDGATATVLVVLAAAGVGAGFGALIHIRQPHVAREGHRGADAGSLARFENDVPPSVRTPPS